MFGENSPSVKYYRDHHGSWLGELLFRIVSWKAFWATSMGLGDRLALLGWAVLGTATIETTVDATQATAKQVLHSTRVSRFGITFYRSEERFVLHKNGMTMDLHRVQWRWPASRKALPDDGGSAVVHDDGLGVTYDWEWYGARMTQTTRMVEQGLHLEQETPWSHAETTLRRVS